MSEDKSPEEVDCDSNGENERNQPSNDASQPAQNKQNKSFLNRFCSFAETHLPPPVDENSDAGKIRKHCKEEIKFCLECAGFVIGGLVAIFVVVQSFVLVGQWVEMRNQISEMQKDRNLDERAWISIQSPIVNVGTNWFPMPNKQYGMSVGFLNTGKTPARITKVEISVGICYAPFTNVDWIVNTNVNAAYSAAPGHENFSVWNEPTPITPQDVLSIQNHERHDYFTWRIEYRDIFNEVHHTQGGFDVTGWPNNFTEHGIIAPYGLSVMD